ncbi:hypothetical protein GCM10027589_46690 [Actinocorallia lasiicapitis]
MGALRYLWVVVVLVVSAACGSGAGKDPVDNGGGGPPPAGQGPKDEDDGPGYSPFELPVGDTSTNTTPGAVYDLIAARDCAGARAQLDRNQNDPELIPYKITPEFTQLLRVGIALCAGDPGTARSRFSGAVKPDEPWFMCELYRASAASLQNRPKAAFGSCPAAPAPVTETPETTPEVTPESTPDGTSEDTATPAEAPTG